MEGFSCKLCSNFIDILNQQHLPGTNIYIGLLHNNLPNEITYVASKCHQFHGGTNFETRAGCFVQCSQGKTYILNDKDVKKEDLLYDAVTCFSHKLTETDNNVNDTEMSQHQTSMPIVIVPGAPVKVKYGTCQYPARILKHTGHGFYTVRYEPQKFNMYKECDEAGIHIGRINPDQSKFQLKKFRMMNTNYHLWLCPS